MQIDVVRFKTTNKSTVSAVLLDGVFECYGLEDTNNVPKIPNHTRIPSGTYELKLRTHGGFHQRYTRKFAFHEGMFEITNVPNFTDVLIHIGNAPKDTSGCLLVGNSLSNDFIGMSTVAYESLYRKILPTLKRLKQIPIQIHTLDDSDFSGYVWPAHGAS